MSPRRFEASLDHWAKLIVEAAPNAMVVVDRLGKIVLVNRAAETLFGSPREQLLGEPVETLIPGRFHAAHPHHVASFFTTPTARAMGAGRELFGRRSDGGEVPIEIGLNPIETEAGRFTLASIIDITERKRADQRFRAVVEASPSAVIVVDAERRISLVNRRTEDLFGYQRDELIGSRFDRLVPERFGAAHVAQVSAFFTDPRARAMGAGRELFGRRKDGSEVPIEIGLTPVATTDGPVVLASIIDITERRRAEELRQRLVAIVEFSTDAIVSRSLDGAVTSWNSGAEHLFGYAAAEAIGEPTLFGDDERERVAQIVAGERVEPFDAVRHHKDGRPIDVSVTLSPIRTASGAIVGTSSIARDISALKRQAAELQRSNTELQQFAYVASHDLQEPLRMVGNYTELLEARYRDQLDARAQKYIHYAADGARRMQRLVADLLAYSRVGSQGKPLVPVSSRKVLDGVLRTLAEPIRASGATVDVGELPIVLADEVQLGQLFQNLLSNALKFRGAAPPVVRIHADRVGDRWRFAFDDNGIGLDVRFAERIFQMFQRLHELGKYEGSGMGLSIAKRIVERHGGEIGVESTPGVGSRFWFTARGGAP